MFLENQLTSTRLALQISPFKHYSYETLKSNDPDLKFFFISVKPSSTSSLGICPEHSRSLRPSFHRKKMGNNLCNCPSLLLLKNDFWKRGAILRKMSIFFFYKRFSESHAMFFGLEKLCTKNILHHSKLKSFIFYKNSRDIDNIYEPLWIRPYKKLIWKS